MSLKALSKGIPRSINCPSVFTGPTVAFTHLNLAVAHQRFCITDTIQRNLHHRRLSLCLRLPRRISLMPSRSYQKPSPQTQLQAYIPAGASKHATRRPFRTAYPSHPYITTFSLIYPTNPIATRSRSPAAPFEVTCGAMATSLRRLCATMAS